MRFTTVLFAGTLFALSTNNAYAYMDPGTGSILLQGLIGTIASGMFVAKMYWAKIKSVVGLSSADAAETGDETASEK